MSLNKRQQENLNVLLTVIIIVGFFSGVGYLIFWSQEVPYVSHMCAGTTMVNVTNYNNGEDSMTYTLNDPQCH